MSFNPLGFFVGDSASDQIVPPKGGAAWLTGIASAAMAFIAVFALTLSLAVGRLADYWALDLARSATVRIVADDSELDRQTQAALQVLRTTPGIESAEILDKDEQLALLQPWLGNQLPIENLPVPRLLNIQLTETGPNIESLRLRLEAEAPGATFDDHGYWRQPVLEASDTLRFLVSVALVLTVIITIIIVVLSAQNAMASNQSIIRTLRLLGARDSYIARAFVRRITLRATMGAAIGMVLGLVSLLAFPAQQSPNGLLAGLTLSGADWFYPLAVPLLVAISAFVASRLAARHHLSGVT